MALPGAKIEQQFSLQESAVGRRISIRMTGSRRERERRQAGEKVRSASTAPLLKPRENGEMPAAKGGSEIRRHPSE